MTCNLLHLNDFHIQLLNQEGELLTSSGQLVFESGQLLSGQEALEQVRKKPLHSYNHHWQQLNQTPIKLPDPRYRHHADLAYRQLEQWLGAMDQNHSLIIAPCYRYQQTQYALLAGMLQALNIQPAGFVHSALLHSYGFLKVQGNNQWPLVHVDLCLHQAHITQLDYRDNQLVIEREWDIPDCGIWPLMNAWMKIVAQSCIQQTRYNPLHSAESEQRLFNQWSSALSQLTQNLQIELDIDGKVVELSRTQFTPLTEQLRAQIAETQGLITLSPIAQLIPGLSGANLNDDHLHVALCELTHEFDGPTQLHLSLPLPNSVLAQEARADTEAKAMRPSHLLINETAYPLSAYRSLQLQGAHLIASTERKAAITFNESDDYWLCDTQLNCMLNGNTVTGIFTIKPGQTLIYANQNIQLIKVHENGA